MSLRQVMLTALHNNWKMNLASVSGVDWYWWRQYNGYCQSGVVNDEQPRFLCWLPRLGPGEKSRSIRPASLHWAVQVRKCRGQLYWRARQKLGMNSDFTPFDQIVLDPELTKMRRWTSVSIQAWTVTYIVLKVLAGTSTSSVKLWRKAPEVVGCFVDAKEWNDDRDDKLMDGIVCRGMSIVYSQVVWHMLWVMGCYLLGTKHGIGNCIVMNHLEEYYPEGVKEFKYMVEKNNIEIPSGICKNLSEEDFERWWMFSWKWNRLGKCIG